MKLTLDVTMWDILIKYEITLIVLGHNEITIIMDCKTYTKCQNFWIIQYVQTKLFSKGKIMHCTKESATDKCISYKHTMV